MRKAALFPVSSADSNCVFASQDAEWVEEEPDAEINSGASKPCRQGLVRCVTPIGPVRSPFGHPDGMALPPGG